MQQLFEPHKHWLYRRCLSQNTPLSQVALGRSEQRFRVQKATTSIASVLNVVVHLAGATRIHSLGHLLVSHARLTAGNRGGFPDDGSA